VYRRDLQRVDERLVDLVADLGSLLRVERPGQIDLDERHGLPPVFRFRDPICGRRPAGHLENFELLCHLMPDWPQHTRPPTRQAE
jgi:hypothetical protein